jgi:hypothetical protein
MSCWRRADVQHIEPAGGQNFFNRVELTNMRLNISYSLASRQNGVGNSDKRSLSMKA